MNIPSSHSRTRNAPLLSILLLLVASAGAIAQTTQPVESGKFILHKIEQAIGEETYTVTKNGDALVVKVDFAFTDRGRRVPLTATFKAHEDLTPESFTIKGSVSRFSTIDSTVDINGAAATIREDKNTRQAVTPERFFTIGGYAPVTMQQMLVRYLAAHKITGPLTTLPGGTVTVEHRGKDKIKFGSREVELDRYSVSGLIWGREALWLDSAQNLIAAVTIDAEFDHFEAVREGYETALATFVGRAAVDGMAALADIAKRMSPERGGALAITGATLIDGNGGPPVADAVVVIDGDRILAAGPSSNIKIPRGARTIDARGKFVLPGLWEMHAHFEQVEWGPVYLAAGVTTARDVGNEFEFITSVRDAIKEGRGLGPRMLMAGIVDGQGPTGWGMIRADTPEEGLAVVQKYHAAGFQQIKIYSSIKLEVLKAICVEAHKLGMSVTGHIPNGLNAFQGVEAGMDQINHVQYITPVMLPKDFRPQPGQPLPVINFQSPEAQSALQFFKTHGTVLDDTLVIFEWSLHPENIPFSQYEPGAAKLPHELEGAINNTGAPAASAARANSIFQMYLDTVGAMHRAGVPVVAGTDQVVPGHSVHRELELYVKAGFTPMEAIQAATLVPAQVMKIENEVGTIAAGKRADLIILDADPLANISNIRSVKTVITGGRVYSCAALWTSVGFKP